MNSLLHVHCLPTFFSSILLILAIQSPTSAEVLYETALSPYAVPCRVTCSQKDRQFKLVVDTGSTHTLLDPTLFGPLGTSKATSVVKTPSGSMDVPLYASPALTVGKLRLPDSVIGAFDTTEIRSMTGFEVEGVLGSSSLANLQLELNYDAQKMSLLRDYSPPANGYLTCRLVMVDAVPFLITKGGQRDLNLMIDLASNEDIALSSKEFAALTSDGMIETSGKGRLLSNSTSQATMRGRFKNFQLFGIDLSGTIVTGSGTHGVVGSRFLLRFNSVIDYAGEKFHYEQRAKNKVFSSQKSLGMILRFGDSPTVFALQPSGIAENAGLQKGDVLVKCNGMDAHKLDIEVLTQLCEKRAGETIQVVVRRDEALYTFALTLPTNN